VLKPNARIAVIGRNLAMPIRFSIRKANSVISLRFLILLKKVSFLVVNDGCYSISIFVGKWREICILEGGD
jgi:hypothetical protein